MQSGENFGCGTAECGTGATVADLYAGLHYYREVTVCLESNTVIQLTVQGVEVRSNVTTADSIIIINVSGLAGQPGFGVLRIL